MTEKRVAKTTVEELGIRSSRPSFLEQVGDLAKLSKATIDNMRLFPHLDIRTGFEESLPEEARDDSYSPDLIRKVVNVYLGSTKAERILDLPDDFRALRDPVAENTSLYPHLVQRWRAEHYDRIGEVDKELDSLASALERFALIEGSKRLTALSRIVDTHDIDLSLDGDLRRALNRWKSGIYRNAGLREDPDYLYGVAFNSLVGLKGWAELEDKDLAKVLIEEEVPIELFERYTGRNVKVPTKKRSRISRVEDDTGSEGGDTRRSVLEGNLIYSHIPLEGYVPTFARGLEMLRAECSNDPNSRQPTLEIGGRTLVVPFTPRESLLARVEDYNRLTNPDGSERSIQNRLRLFQKGFYTSAGMLYNYEGDMSVPVASREEVLPRRAKMQLVCPTLLSLAPGFNQAYVEVPDFNSFEGEEIDLTRGFWNQGLTRAQVLDHEGWRKLVGDDEEGRILLDTYSEIIFSEVQRLYRENAAMGFWKRNSAVNANELRAPWASGLSGRSSASGNDSLNGGATFLRASVPRAD